MTRIGIREIAKLAGVSVGTVDRALHSRGRISQPTRERILGIARGLGFKPNLVARALSVGRAAMRIGVCLPREIHSYFDQVRDGIIAEAERFEYLGVELVFRPTERLAVQEAEHVLELMNSGVHAMIITPGDPQKLAPVIDEAEKKNIRVVCVDSDAPASSRSTAVCLDAGVSGKIAAELLGGFVAPESHAAIITGMLQIEAHRWKTSGFCEWYPKFCPGGSVIEVVEAHDDEDEAFQKCLALLQLHPSLAGLYVSTANCLPVCRALGASGLSGKTKLIASDLSAEMACYFEKGTIAASIHGRPFVMGEIAMRLLVNHIANGSPLPSSYYLQPHIVLRSNLHLFRETAPQKSGHVSSGSLPLLREIDGETEKT